MSAAIERTGLARNLLAGQVAVVTGGGRGIGRETVCALAWLGARVVIAERSDDGQETERLVREAGGTALFVGTDVSAESDVQNLALATVSAFGPADILINGAIHCPVAPLLEMTLDDWDRVMAVNLRGAFLTCRAFLPAMLAQKRGTIINMVSTDAMPSLTAYIASKQGLVGLTQSLAGEVGPSGVHVVALAPGFVDTPGLRAVGHGLAPRLGLTEEQFLGLSLHPAYTGMMPADHAGAATAYLAARLAPEHQGQVVTGYAVLEQMGLIASPALPVVDTTAPQKPALPVPAELTQAALLAGDLEKAIAATEAELNKLPFFVRPLAKTGFRERSGQSLADWARTAANLRLWLEAMAANGSTDAAPAAAASPAAAEMALREAYPRLRELLERLILYYRGVPVETRRFTKDADLLSDITQTMQQREELIGQVIAHVGSLLTDSGP